MDLSRIAAALGPRPLTILSNGAGADSMAMMALAERGELMELLLSKGYDRKCGFGER